MKVAYLAHPFRAKSYWGIFGNVRRAEVVALALWNMGIAVICPGKNTENFDGAAPDTVWLQGDLEFLRRSDLVVMAPGWKASVGAQTEWDEATRLCIPIFYWEFDQEAIRKFGDLAKEEKKT